MSALLKSEESERDMLRHRTEVNNLEKEYLKVAEYLGGKTV
jgi:hypothetical protein